MSKKETYFQKDWLQMPEFAQWLHDVKDDNTTAGYKRYLKKKSNSQGWESQL